MAAAPVLARLAGVVSAVELEGDADAGDLQIPALVDVVAGGGVDRVTIDRRIGRDAADRALFGQTDVEPPAGEPVEGAPVSLKARNANDDLVGPAGEPRDHVVTTGIRDGCLATHLDRHPAPRPTRCRVSQNAAEHPGAPAWNRRPIAPEPLAVLEADQGAVVILAHRLGQCDRLDAAVEFAVVRRKRDGWAPVNDALGRHQGHGVPPAASGQGRHKEGLPRRWRPDAGTIQRANIEDVHADADARERHRTGEDLGGAVDGAVLGIQREAIALAWIEVDEGLRCDHLVLPAGQWAAGVALHDVEALPDRL